MKTTPRFLTVLLAMVALGSVSFKPVSNDVAMEETKQLIADWERAKAYTLEYLKVSTDEVVNSKPTAEMRTFGQQYLHIAEANYGLAAAASGKKSPVEFGSLEKSDQYKTKASLTKAVTESYDYVISIAKEMNDQKLGEPVKVFDKDMTRGLALAKVFEHQTHHRGQTTVYLRLKGITPPNEMLF